MPTAAHPQESDLIFDWNHKGDDPLSKRTKPVAFDDETLRDGLQSPSAINPSIAQKIELLRLMEKLGIDRVDLGLPGAGPQHREHIEALLKVIVSEKMRIIPGCAVRTVISDIEPIDALQQKFGIKIQASAFLGTSPIRQYAEGWTLQKLMETMEVAVKWAVGHGIPVMFVTEDTTRSKPEDVKALYQRAIEIGAYSICVCDTCGHVTPHGVKQLLKFVIEDVIKPTGKKVLLNWHGHSDRGLAVANSLAAVEAGADIVHGTALGLGERVGNCQMDQLLVNLKLMGLIKNDLTHLAEYVRKAHEYTGVPLPQNYPVFGEDAFETGTGVHAAAVIKAKKKGDDWLADRVYSGVPAGDFGLAQKIRIGHMSGKSNVIFWLESHKIEATDARVDKILAAAKSASRLLTEAELKALAG
ncbi:MAG: 2-isopropylmalate synthase [Planctomycetes bacterium]|nr:2-isopropylmalate synthase [Planctomycetota bacterium]